MLQLFQTKKGSFFHRHTCIQWLHCFSLYNALYTLVRFLCCFIRNVLSHIILLCTARLSLFHTETLFSPLKMHCLQMLELFLTKKGSFCFFVILIYSSFIAFSYIMHCIHLSEFFCFIRNFLSYIFFCAQLVSVCFTMKLCFYL